MTYIEGFVIAVPAANKESYRKHAADAVVLFKDFGAIRLMEAWGDEVPDGKMTDFKGAVKAKEDEVVVFSWLEYPSKAVRDAANEKMKSDPRMKDSMEQMPFDGKRMIYAGFGTLLEEKATKTAKPGYVDGMVAAVPSANKEAYRTMAAGVATLLKEHGALRIVENWGDDVPDGKLTDYKRAVKAKPDETIVFSWIEWPSKDVHDKAWPVIMGDPRMHTQQRPFDGQRMVYGGFVPILDI